MMGLTTSDIGKIERVWPKKAEQVQATQNPSEEVDTMAMDAEVSIIEEVEPTGGPTVTEDGDGNVTVDFSAEAEVNKILGDTHDANLA